MKSTVIGEFSSYRASMWSFRIVCCPHEQAIGQTVELRVIWDVETLLPSPQLCHHRTYISLHWRHNGRDYISNHQPHDCLLNRSFGRILKKTSKLRGTSLCAGNSPGAGEFPAQMASKSENVSIWWRHHVWLTGGGLWPAACLIRHPGDCLIIR